MATDTRSQAIQEHLDYAAEVLPEIVDALRLLRGNATVLSPQEQRVLIDAVNFDVEMAPDMEYAQRSARLGARIDDPNTRIILVREETE